MVPALLPKRKPSASTWGVESHFGTIDSRNVDIIKVSARVCSPRKGNVMTNVSKREFLAASIGVGVSLSAVRKALAQQDGVGSSRTERAAPAGNQRVPSRRVKTTKL